MSRKSSSQFPHSGRALTLGLVSGLGVAASTVSCSREFSSCDSAKTCVLTTGSGAESDHDAGANGEAETVAGAPSDAGAGGGGEPQPVCSKDADCNDGLACDGTETCVAGVCQPGVSPCTNPDPANCEALCIELDGAASCKIQGQDKDDDGYLSSACAVQPGADCDDNSAAVHPGAVETCDGIDNDCNGKIDLKDGLPISGTTVALGPANAVRDTPTIGWATDKSVYGIAYYDGSTSDSSDLYFETVDQSGAITLAPLPLNPGSQSGGTPLALAWGGLAFALTWTSADTSQFYFRSLTSTGELDDTIEVNTPGRYLAATGLAENTAGTWAALFSVAESSSYYVQTLPPIGDGLVSVSPAAGMADLGASSIAAVGSSFVIGYSTAAHTAAVSLWETRFTLSVPITVTGQTPVVGSGADGFAVAVTPALAGNAPAFYAFSATGAPICGPVTLADDHFVPAGIVATKTGYLVVSSGAVRVQEVLANCRMGALFTVDAGPARNVSIAGSAAGYGVVWQDTLANVPNRHVFGPKFCN